MVGWVPRDRGIRQVKVDEFVERINAAQVFGLQGVPLILQYDGMAVDLRPWGW